MYNVIFNLYRKCMFIYLNYLNYLNICNKYYKKGENNYKIL